MWWILFTAADLYIGLIVLDVMASSLPVERRHRVGIARKAIIGLLVALALLFAVKLVRR